MISIGPSTIQLRLRTPRFQYIKKCSDSKNERNRMDTHSLFNAKYRQRRDFDAIKIHIYAFCSRGWERSSNADMTGEWAITKNGYYGGHSLCKIRFTNNRRGAPTTAHTTTIMAVPRLSVFKSSTRFTVNSACKVTIKAANTLGANLRGVGYLSRDGNNMVGKSYQSERDSDDHKWRQIEITLGFLAFRLFTALR